MSIYKTYAADCDMCGRSLESSNHGEVVGAKSYVLEMLNMCGWEMVESDSDIEDQIICVVCRRDK